LIFYFDHNTCGTSLIEWNEYILSYLELLCTFGSTFLVIDSSLFSFCHFCVQIIKLLQLHIKYLNMYK